MKLFESLKAAYVHYVLRVATEDVDFFFRMKI
jgi:hypothetical protein